MGVDGTVAALLQTRQAKIGGVGRGVTLRLSGLRGWWYRLRRGARLSPRRWARLELRQRVVDLRQENDTLSRERDRLTALVLAGVTADTQALVESLRQQLHQAQVACEGAQVAREALEARLAHVRAEAADTERELRNQIAALEWQMTQSRPDIGTNGCRGPAATAS